MATGEISALLGRGTRYEGKITFDGRVRIDGHFDGEVFSPGTLVVGEGAEVRGRVDVGVLIVLGGEVWGEVMARELVELHKGAIVHANIETPQFFVDRGAVFDGRCTMGDDEPVRHDISSEDLLDELSSEHSSIEVVGTDTMDEDAGERADATQPTELDDAAEENP
ncbi:MAG: polymer-forming cytoskeletal protein [Myxococcota bacterium]